MMMSAVGKKNRTAAKTHRLMDDVPLCAAAAIQRGPRTAAMLNRSTSQKPIARRSWDLPLAISVMFPAIEPTRLRGLEQAEITDAQVNHTGEKQNRSGSDSYEVS